MLNDKPQPWIAKETSQSCGHLSYYVNTMLGDDPDVYRNHFRNLPNNGVITSKQTAGEILEIVRQNLVFLVEQIEAAQKKDTRHRPSMN